MSRRATIVIVALAMLWLAPATSEAFDGRREGFVLGFGAGGGILLVDELTGIGGFSTDLKIGHGFNERWLLHYSGKQLWHVEQNTLITEALPLVAVTHFFADTSPSGFVSFGAGPAIVAAFIESSVGGGTGFAAFIGGGYEFVRGGYVELGVSPAFFSSRPMVNIQATVNFLAY